MELIREAGHVGGSCDSHASTPEPVSLTIIFPNLSVLSVDI